MDDWNRAAAIARLNDEFRENAVQAVLGRHSSDPPPSARVFVSRSVAALPPIARFMVVNKVGLCEAFDKANGPEDAHRFGVVEHGGETFHWRIDYRDAAGKFPGEDPADPAMTTRILTVTREHEY